MPAIIMDEIKIIKKEVMPDELIQPSRAVPGTPGRVLAWESVPDFACDYALINDGTSRAGLVAAFKHVMHVEDHPKGVTMAQWLENVIDGPIREVAESEDAQWTMTFK